MAQTPNASPLNYETKHIIVSPTDSIMLMRRLESRHERICDDVSRQCN